MRQPALSMSRAGQAGAFSGIGVLSAHPHPGAISHVGRMASAARVLHRANAATCLRVQRYSYSATRSYSATAFSFLRWLLYSCFCLVWFFILQPTKQCCHISALSDCNLKSQQKGKSALSLEFPSVIFYQCVSTKSSQHCL